MSMSQPAWTVLGALLGLLLLCGCPENQAQDDDASDDDGADDDGADDDSGDDDSGDDDTVVDNLGPVRVLFLVDVGAAWQCTDFTSQRFAVIEQRIQDLLALSYVSIGYVMVGEEVAVQPFTTVSTDLAALWDPGVMLEQASDLQGGMATAVDCITADLPGIDLAELPYTRYVVVIITDSLPEPECHAGCEDDATACEDDLDNDQDGLVDLEDPSCDTYELYGICNYTGAIPPGSYVDFDGLCPAYNQEPELLAHVADLVMFETTGGVGDVTLHARLVSDSVPLIEANCGLTGQEKAQLAASALLMAMTKSGGGTFTSSEPSQPFLDGIDFGAISMP